MLCSSHDHLRSENSVTVAAPITLTGSCLCGAVTYEITGDARRFYHCHCSRCRKATGTGHASNLFFQPAALRWLTGRENVRAFKLPEAMRFTNQFCAVCGARLPRQPQDTDTVIAPAGSLDAEPPLHPEARIFVASRASWSCCGDGVPSFDGAPPR
jgi:hypothetical protein